MNKTIKIMLPLFILALLFQCHYSYSYDFRNENQEIILNEVLLNDIYNDKFNNENEVILPLLLEDLEE